MKRLLFIGLMTVSLSMSALAEKINYEFVADVKSKRMGEYLVRYLVTLDSMCMGYVQSLMSDYSNHWSIYQTKTLCELDGKSTATGFTDATITELEFEGNSIYMVISTTPLISGGEYLRICRIKVNNGKFSPMSCDKPKPVGG